ncbi:MAG TPA: hypothetical protein VKA36_00025 [Solirubrobacterales bacterium]|nr:hypothetical protein [Solirubrobacterales bacterium]
MLLHLNPQELATELRDEIEVGVVAERDQHRRALSEQPLERLEHGDHVLPLQVLVQVPHLLGGHLHLAQRGRDLAEGDEAPLPARGDQGLELLDLLDRPRGAAAAGGSRAEPGASLAFAGR